ncbi:MAG: electron transport complex subunit RsxC [Succinivibrio sp.]|nr:electron transport complex subunit RsxC [Succinivibrio sp.]
MAFLIDKIRQGKVWRFFGGIRPPELKQASASPIEELRIPSLITLPVERHLGEGGELLVKVGDQVKKGQQLTIPKGERLVPLHASTSGTVTGIGPQILPHPSGFTGTCITIKPDGHDLSVESKPLPEWEDMEPAALLARIREFGVEGLGGALFQTASKLQSALDGPDGCNVFIVNGCECEPVLTCDDRIMQEYAADIATGIRIIQHIIKPQLTVVAIEDNKSEAIAAMRAALEGSEVQLRVIPTRYPSGQARNLIRIITSLEIPFDEHTAECGVVVDNVETVLSIKQAVIDGVPVTSRVITVGGSSMGRIGNVRIRLGSSVRFVLNSFHLNPEFHQRVVLGGPMMGFTLPTIDVPVTKAASCILAPGSAELPLRQPALNCMRCGRCARVCPSRLVPYKLYALSLHSEHGKAQQNGITDCTLCGCCAFVCPSRINLTLQFRRERNIAFLLQDKERRNERALERIKAHEEKEAQERRKRAERKAAALQRIKEQGKPGPSPRLKLKDDSRPEERPAREAVTSLSETTRPLPQEDLRTQHSIPDETLAARRAALEVGGSFRSITPPARAAAHTTQRSVADETASGGSAKAQVTAGAEAAAQSSPRTASTAAAANGHPITQQEQPAAASSGSSEHLKSAPADPAVTPNPLPYALRRSGEQKSVREFTPWELPPEHQAEHSLVGLPSDPNRLNPILPRKPELLPGETPKLQLPERFKKLKNRK